MNRGSEFQPEWVSAPGETINEVLRQRAMNIVEFASRSGLSLPVAVDLIEGRGTITIAIARKLERSIGASVEFWIARDYQYRQDVMRLRAERDGWLREVPVGDLIRFGWLSPTPHPTEELSACLDFFGVGSVHEWRAKYGAVFQGIAFRTSPSFDSNLGSVAAWLRRGELEAIAAKCGQWNPERFRGSLDAIRRLTRLKDPQRFIPKLQRLCADSGVAVVAVRAPTGCRASGAATFLADGRALMLFSFRHLTDDHFWFTFFHEAAHLLLHPPKRLYIEGIDAGSRIEEEEANTFASETIVPRELQSEFVSLRADSNAVIRFASKAGVCPGLIVGQLQYMGRIRQNQLNGLKRRFSWGEEE